ncbi:uncharacterized protein DUF3108 [Dongia mobilis]|uniref:Uncharacterized protein DUF3108 n=1 Tax=Dongia mobilis TaxID=578943 RepID=A0A4R6X1E2_9PROT|nr:DUF3108 domain-containing protein [Dongia mobilis]TDQ84278.1 uncharacterized protein DUF3108 [Dongia mobilis]
MRYFGRQFASLASGLASGLISGLAFWLSLGALPAQAAEPVTLTYTGYMAGLPVFSLTAQVKLPGEGKAAGNGAYSLNADAATSGNFRLLYPYRATMVSSGSLAEQKAAPKQFRSVAEIMGRQEAVTLTYGQGGAVAIEAVPLTRQAQDAANRGFARGTIDPASAIVAAVAKFAATASCAGTYQLFDGVRRYDLELSQGGFADLAPLAQSYYDGSATECVAQPRLLEGFAPSAMSSQFYPQSARLFLAPAVPGFPAVPVRIEAQNALGLMTLDLTGVR